MSRCPLEEYEPDKWVVLSGFMYRSRPFESLSPLSPLICDVFATCNRYGTWIPLSPWDWADWSIDWSAFQLNCRFALRPRVDLQRCSRGWKYRLSSSRWRSNPSVAWPARNRYLVTSLLTLPDFCLLFRIRIRWARWAQWTGSLNCRCHCSTGERVLLSVWHCTGQGAGAGSREQGTGSREQGGEHVVSTIPVSDEWEDLSRYCWCWCWW